MKFMERLTGILVKPGETMKDIIKEPRIEEAVVIVGIYAILSMLSTYIASTHINYVYDIPSAGSMAGLRTIMTVVTLVFGLILPFIAWLVISGILHLFSMAFGGSGKFYPPIVTGIGYSEIVKIFTVIIAILLLTQTPVITLQISSTSNLSSISNMTNQLYSNPFYILSQIVVLIGLLWSSYLGALAIKEGEKLTMTQSLIVVGIPLALYIVVSFGPMLLGFL
jgi:hypothetical protein